MDELQPGDLVPTMLYVEQRQPQGNRWCRYYGIVVGHTVRKGTDLVWVFVNGHVEPFFADTVKQWTREFKLEVNR